MLAKYFPSIKKIMHIVSSKESAPWRINFVKGDFVTQLLLPFMRFE
jgi:hypothetical protein